MGNDIVGFKNLLAGYKSTIRIAIGDANLRATAVSANAIQEFKELLENTTADLQEHLKNLDDKLEALRIHGNDITDENEAERGQISEEIDGAQECLAVCARASHHVDEVRTNVFEGISAADDAHQVIISTFGGLISAKRVSAGVKATQWLGQISDAVLQQLAQSRGIDLSSRSRTVTSVEEQAGGNINLRANVELGRS
ncbi:uncharacterized protein BDR25DRAFT_377689 [Lindgomyces ingoldianus]|uniref:Uncharacterized protein n=1 Tax=Lindgomyces ingoldianus TaxID=673940 RepID=A0ACB6QGC4_9PLEO|nr:uncharacterized protein BDR25DRAFT_377689 [Lindgomyces ingoldianus]KAF2466033.1 hypothetical protein BDR25DRAFT_377689 [Lindgomyces ingoldianus]